MDRIMAEEAIARILGAMGLPNYDAQKRAKAAVAPSWGELCNVMPDAPKHGSTAKAELAKRDAYAAWLAQAIEAATSARWEAKVGRTGMRAVCRLFLTFPDGEIDVTRHACMVLVNDPNGKGIIIRGCGFNRCLDAMEDIAYRAICGGWVPPMHDGSFGRNLAGTRMDAGYVSNAWKSKAGG